ncbi:hypothetical protein [Amycolatopsis taiwanensis]|uniref:hypothetical protein n=1 Tax=Amycolatopsis taiwanensis TaxID=342230 RepID=UPI0004AD9E5B|nr:hypothetical protein [Amycolatopsis taiwanensis]
MINEVCGDNAVGRADDIAEERGRLELACLAGQDAAVERVAKECLIGGEPLSG